jgi:ribose transport system substrate-binding protein
MLKKRILGVIVLVLVAAFVAACGANGGGGGGGGFEDSEIVVVMPAAEHGWIAAVIFFAEQRGQELLDEGLGGFRLLTSANIAEQAAQLDELISQNVDVIVLFPHSDELDFAAQRVVDAEIPLFVFNRNVNVDFNSRLLGSNLLIGGESGRKIADVLGGEGIVAAISVPAVGSTNYERHNSFQDAIADYPGIEIINITTTAISIEEALTVTTDLLTAHPHIDAIFTIDDSLSLGALQAIREAGRTDIRVINGSGGSQVYFHEIANEPDIYLFTATFSPTMIMDTMDLAVEWLNGRREFPEITIIPPSIVTRDNVDDFFAPGSPW